MIFSSPAMHGILIPVFVSFSLLTGPAPAAAESLPGVSIGDKRDYQVTFGYWNDNFLFKELLGNKANTQRDDFQTASFWLQTACEQEGKWWLCDSNFSILTDKAGRFRTDILAVRLSREFPVSHGTFQAGMGLSANGDFGGSSIQNGYHRKFGYRKVTLPYSVNPRLGGIFLLRYKPVFLKSGHTRMGGYVSSYLRTAVIPCNARAGLEFNAAHAYRGAAVHVQAITGYTDYYGGSKPLSVLFENGFTWGLLVSGGKKGAYGASLWYTNNQYGLRQYQFGISLILGWNGSRMSDLNEVTFP